MPWRKWFVRGLAFSIIGSCIAVAVIYQRWTDPAMVRELVLAKLQEMYPGAVITVDSARLRILGGIQVNELRMSRRDDPDRTEFFHVPSAILYHDKERMNHGELALRKIELHRPRLRAVRLRDGTWNLKEIYKKSPTGVSLPTLVLHHGTIVLEDQQAPLPGTPIEIGDVELSFINDPINIIAVVGTAHSGVLGDVQLKGTINRDTKEIALKTKTIGTTLGPALMSHVAFECPKLAELQVQAKVDLDFSLAFCTDPDRKEPPDYNLRLQVSEGQVRHPELPLALDEVQCTLECGNGAVEIGNFTARSGKALLKGRARTQLPCPDQNFEAELEVQHLNVDAELAARVSEKVHALQQLFQAVGPTTVRIACARRDGRWANLSSGAEPCFTLQPEGGQICFKYFPFPLKFKADQGTFLHWWPAKSRTDLNAVCYAGDRPVQIVGDWTGYGAQASASFDVAADEIPIEHTLIGALPEKLRKLTHSFRPTGKINLRAHLQRTPGSTDFRHEYHIALDDGTVCWQEFPYLLEKVRGFLDILPGQWVFHGGQGRHGEGEVKIDGKSLPGVKGDDGLELTISGQQLELNQDMRGALAVMPQLARSWDSFRPRGKLNFGARVTLPPGRPEDLDVGVNLNGAAIDPQFFPFLIGDIAGRFRYHKNFLTMAKVTARHQDTTLALNEGVVELLPGGGHKTEFNELRVNKLWADDQLLQALPRALRSFTSSLQLTRPVDIAALLSIKQAAAAGSMPEISWDGEMKLQDQQFSSGITFSDVKGVVGCRGTYDGNALKSLKGNLVFDQATVLKQRVRNVTAGFKVDEHPDWINLDMKAPFYGGHVTSQVHVEMTSAMKYAVRLNVSDVDLQKFGAQNMGQPGQLAGKLQGGMYLEGQGSNADTLDGYGEVQVHHGRLYNLPLLLDLLKFLGLRLPDRTAFEDVVALFSIHGNRAAVKRLDLQGNLVSLIGRGEFNLDGSDLNLDFSPTWIHSEDKVLKPIIELFSKNILIIEMRGQVDSNPDHLKFNKRFVPLISDPLRDLRQSWESDRLRVNTSER